MVLVLLLLLMLFLDQRAMAISILGSCRTQTGLSKVLVLDRVVILMNGVKKALMGKDLVDMMKVTLRGTMPLGTDMDLRTEVIIDSVLIVNFTRVTEHATTIIGEILGDSMLTTIGTSVFLPLMKIIWSMKWLKRRIRDLTR
jgi:hypothetical protein